jgi:hypothetical protein
MGAEHGCIGCATTDAFQVLLVRLRPGGTSPATARSAGLGTINKDEPQSYSQHMCFSTFVYQTCRQRRAILLAMAMALDFDHFAKVDQRLTELFHVCFVVFNPCMLPILGFNIEAGIPHDPLAFLAVPIHGGGLRCYAVLHRLSRSRSAVNLTAALCMLSTRPGRLCQYDFVVGRLWPSSTPIRTTAGLR